MKQMLIKTGLVIIFLAGSFCGVKAAHNPGDTIIINKDVQLVKITDTVYIHISWTTAPKFGRFPSNGLLYVKNGKGLLIDTPMENDQTNALLDYVRDSMHVQITHFIAGHYHDDCIGGLKILHELGVKSYSGLLTQQKCKELQLEVPQNAFTDSCEVDFYPENISCYYLGGGHTKDNIVVYFKNEQLLFGGCLVKANNARGMGNTAEADIAAWPATINSLKSKFTEVKCLIPGHGPTGGSEQLDHTLMLLKNYTNTH